MTNRLASDGCCEAFNVVFCVHSFYFHVFFNPPAASTLPPASLKLLVPPVRLMAASMWKVVQQDSSVMDYDKLLDFISLATEMVPELLSPSQKVQLMLGLRAKVKGERSLYLLYHEDAVLKFPSPVFTLVQLVLELCRGDGVANLKTIQAHLDKIHTCCVELNNCGQMVLFNKTM